MKLKKAMSYADLALGIEKKQKGYHKIIEGTDSTDLQKKTAKMNLENLNKYAQEVFQAMEEDKQSMGIQPQYAKAAYGLTVGQQGMVKNAANSMLNGYTINPFESNNYKDQVISGPDGQPYVPLAAVENSSSTQTTEYGVKDNGVGYIIPAVNMARGIFEPAQKLNAADYMTTKKLTPSRFDIAPQLRDIEASGAIARRNNRSASPTQIMSGNIATSDWEARAKAGLYSNKWNIDQQDRARVEQGNIALDKENKLMKLQIGDINNQAKAAKENMLQTGMSQALETYYRGRSDKQIAKQLELSDKQFNDNLKAQKEIADRGLDQAYKIWAEQKGLTEKEMETGYKMFKEELDKKYQITPTDNTALTETPGLDEVVLDLTTTQQADKNALVKKQNGQFADFDKQYGDLHALQIRQESGFVPTAYNTSSGAAGLGQFTAETAYDKKMKLHPEVQKIVVQKTKEQIALGKLYLKKTRTSEDNIAIKYHKDNIAKLSEQLKVKQNALFAGLKSSDPQEKAKALENAKYDERFNQTKAWNKSKELMNDYVKKYGNEKVALLAYHSGPGRIEALAEKQGVSVKQFVKNFDIYSPLLTVTERKYLQSIVRKSRTSYKASVDIQNNPIKIKMPSMNWLNPTPESLNR